jgi:superfamily II DNA/RNA helicase
MINTINYSAFSNYNSNQIATSYLTNRFAELNLAVNPSSFRGTETNDIVLFYKHLNGNLMHYQISRKVSYPLPNNKEEGSFSEIFTRIRQNANNPKAKRDKDGKIIRYIQAANSGVHLYFTGIVDFGITDFSRVFFVEGEFKAYKLCSLGICAVGIGGRDGLLRSVEKKTIHTRTGDTFETTVLREFVEDFEELPHHEIKEYVLLLDSDTIGNEDFYHTISNLLTVAQDRKLPFAFGFGNPAVKYGKNAKGIDDLLRLAAQEEKEQEVIAALQSLKTSPYFVFQPLTESSLHYFERLIKADIYLQCNTYLHEISQDLKKHIAQNNRIAINAATGTGKTTFILKELINSLKGKSIFIVPTNPILNQLAHNTNYQNDENILFLSSMDSFENRQLAASNLFAKCIVCTYDMLVAILPTLSPEFRNLIIDEAHLLSSAMGYRKKVLFEVNRISKNFEKNILISATLNPLIRELGYKIIQVERLENATVNLQTVAYKIDAINALFDYTQKQLTENGGKIVIELNSRNKGLKLKKALCQANIKTEFVCKEFNEDKLNEIVKDELLPNDLQVLICTSLVEFGVNFKNTDLYEFIYVNAQQTFQVESYLQLMGRARCMQEYTFSLFLPQSQVEKTCEKQRYKSWFQSKMKAAQAEIAQCNLSKTYYEAQLIAHEKQHTHKSTGLGQAIVYNPNTANYELNKHFILFVTQQDYATCVGYEQTINELTSYPHINNVGIIYLQSATHQEVVTAKKEVKIVHEEFVQELTTIAKTDTVAFATILSIGKNKPLHQQYHKYFKTKTDATNAIAQEFVKKYQQKAYLPISEVELMTSTLVELKKICSQPFELVDKLAEHQLKPYQLHRLLGYLGANQLTHKSAKTNIELYASKQIQQRIDAHLGKAMTWQQLEELCKDFKHIFCLGNSAALRAYLKLFYKIESKRTAKQRYIILTKHTFSTDLNSLIDYFNLDNFVMQDENFPLADLQHSETHIPEMTEK